jgi:hypothetical protein
MTDEFKDNEIYPAEASEQGCNAYYLPGCDIAGHRPAYAACLKKISDRKNGRLTTSLSECSAAIGKKQCPAQRMRKEEIVEGRAIYFVNRNKLRSFMQYQTEMEQQRWASMSFDKGEKKSKPRVVAEPPKAPPTAPKHFLDMNTGSYADAINAALKPTEPAAAPALKPVQPASPVATAPAGLSMMERARLKFAAAKAA